MLYRIVHNTSSSTQLANGGGVTSPILDLSYFGHSTCRQRYEKGSVGGIEQYTMCGGDGRIPKESTNKVEALRLVGE
jgi:hypothetical protein